MFSCLPLLLFWLKNKSPCVSCGCDRRSVHGLGAAKNPHLNLALSQRTNGYVSILYLVLVIAGVRMLEKMLEKSDENAKKPKGRKNRSWAPERKPIGASCTELSPKDDWRKGETACWGANGRNAPDGRLRNSGRAEGSTLYSIILMHNFDLNISAKSNTILEHFRWLENIFLLA